jgi:NAD(P)-dependent dehydrogenase (short-subunit alcohol dehydrogenase family)
MEMPAYRASKTALNMLAIEWQRMLKADGVKVWALCPGFVATNYMGIGAETLKAYGAGDPVESGAFFKAIVEGEKDEYAGKFFNAAGELPY